MTRHRVSSVFDRLVSLRAIMSDLKSHMIKAGSSSSADELRASILVGARAVNIFVNTYAISDHMYDTSLTHLNSKMIRLSADPAECLDTFNHIVSMIDRIVTDIDAFAIRFSPEERNTSPKRAVPDDTDSDTDDLSCEE